MPTHKQMNEAMAKLCGWTIHGSGRWLEPSCIMTYKSVPDYCNDRNLLVEVYGALWKQELQFGNTLIKMFGLFGDDEPVVAAVLFGRICINLPMIIKAALRTCDTWPWGDEERVP